MKGGKKLADFLGTIASVVTALMSNVGTIAETVISTPLFAVVFGVWFAGASVGIVKRISSVR